MPRGRVAPLRFLDDGPAAGPWNMGVDEALLATAQRSGVATLRLYTWQGPWLSLGYGQSVGEARVQACRRADVGIVRRMTGGGAVLHGQDLTYALATPVERLPSGLSGAYDRVAAALVAALRELGVAAERSAPAPPTRGRGPFDCFAAPAAHEICIGGLKLAGSAQRRADGALLQHGSLRLRPDPPAARVASGLGPGATSLAEVACTAPELALREALARAFGDLLGAPVVPGSLDREECESAEMGVCNYGAKGHR
ncbi:MAG: lipoate--protein ligase family protein [Proteobacteria bacterium]|nr:lipoate--protein ligase family protein [Pseudomonadota bacterium]